MRRMLRAAGSDAQSWEALNSAMGTATDPSDAPYDGPWRAFIGHLVALSDRRAHGLLPGPLTRLETEGLVALEEEIQRRRSEASRRGSV